MSCRKCRNTRLVVATWVFLVIMFFLLSACASTGETFRVRCMGPQYPRIEIGYADPPIRVGCYKDLNNYYCGEGWARAEGFAGIWWFTCERTRW